MFNFIRYYKKRAQALVETALVFPLFLLIFIAIFDFGFFFFNYVTLYNGVREATRAGAVGENYDLMKFRLERYVANSINPIIVKVYNSNGVEIDNTDRSSENRIKVSASFDGQSFFIPLGSMLSLFGETGAYNGGSMYQLSVTYDCIIE